MTMPEPIKGFTHRQNPGNHRERNAKADLKAVMNMYRVLYSH